MSILEKETLKSNDMPMTKNPLPYIIRWSQITGLSFVLGSMTAFIASRQKSNEVAIDLLRQSTLIKSDPASFALKRTTSQKALSSMILANGFKYGFFAGTFSFVQLGLSYIRGYWDPWNTLCAGSFTGAFCGGLMGSAKGLKSGFVYGSLLSVPICIVESLIRIYVHDDDLLPYKLVVTDNAESLSTFVKNQAVLKNPHLYNMQEKKKDE